MQRALASKDLSHANGTTVLARYFKLLHLFIMIFPGMAAKVLFKDEVACADPVGNFSCILCCDSYNIIFQSVTESVAVRVGVQTLHLLS
jgi:hypothetical protein